jgi:hypothetical protein
VATLERSADDGSWRSWLAAASALALVYALYVGRGGPYPIPLLLLGVALLLATGALLLRHRPWLPMRGRLLRLLGFGFAVQLALIAVWPLTNPLQRTDLAAYAPLWGGLAAVAVLSALPLVGLRLARWPRLAGLIAIHFVLGLWVIALVPEPFIDVWVLQTEGARALAEGINPYLPIYPNIYGPDAPYYAPELLVDGQLTIGLTYPPLSLLLIMPAELIFGDPRYAHLVAIELTAVVIALTRPGPISFTAALLYLFTPWTFYMVAGAFTEPLVVLAIATVVATAVRWPRLLGPAVGFMIAVKQYLIVGLPLALLLLARNGATRWRVAWQSVGLAVAITLPFFLWDPQAYTWSTIGALALQIFRPDSLTYLAALPGDWGPRLSFLGAALILLLAPFIIRRVSRTPAGFAGSLALVLMVFFAFSRQGSTNYYITVVGALCCAIAAGDWNGRAADPTSEGSA